MIKSCSGIVAALAVMYCFSQSEAKDGLTGGLKLRADLIGYQGPEWILYEDLPEDGEIVSLNKAGDSDEVFEICQSEGGEVGTVTESQGGAVCATQKGPMDSFYVLHVGNRAADGVDEGEGDEGKVGGLAGNLKKRVQDRNYEDWDVGADSMMPKFDWTEQEQSELKDAIREALEATGAWQRYLEEAEEHSGELRKAYGKTG